MNVFFDTDIILDVATAREPFCEASAMSLSLAEMGRIEGFTSAIIFINVFYVLRKLIGREDALKFLKDLEQILSITLYFSLFWIVLFYHTCKIYSISNNVPDPSFITDSLTALSLIPLRLPVVLPEVPSRRS